MREYTYLLILFFTIIVCFIASFDKRIRFYKYFLSFLKSAILVAIPFVIWDIWFTSIGIWWFDYNYTIGLKLFSLPLEEYLFFVCIPFSCVFTYYCFELFFNMNKFQGLNNMLMLLTFVVSGWVLLQYYDRLYTLITFSSLLLSLLYFYLIKKIVWIGSASVVFSILMIGFFPVNGILTGTGIESPIVNYNINEIMGYRMLTIPLEDAVYGYVQFLWVLYFFEKWSSVKYNKSQIINK